MSMVCGSQDQRSADRRSVRVAQAPDPAGLGVPKTQWVWGGWAAPLEPHASRALPFPVSQATRIASSGLTLSTKQRSTA
jgi:hypothetical protein